MSVLRPPSCESQSCKTALSIARRVVEEIRRRGGSDISAFFRKMLDPPQRLRGFQLGIQILRGFWLLSHFSNLFGGGL